MCLMTLEEGEGRGASLHELERFGGVREKRQLTRRRTFRAVLTSAVHASAGSK